VPDVNNLRRRSRLTFCHYAYVTSLHAAPENLLVLMCRVRDRDLSSVRLIARTRAVLYGESWPVANYRFASFSLRRTSVYIYNPVNRAALYFKTRLSRPSSTLVSPSLSSLRELRELFLS